LVARSRKPIKCTLTTLEDARYHIAGKKQAVYPAASTATPSLTRLLLSIQFI